MNTPNQIPALPYNLVREQARSLPDDQKQQLLEEIWGWLSKEEPAALAVQEAPRPEARITLQVHDEGEDTRDLTTYLLNGDRKKLLEIGGFMLAVLVLCALYSAIFGKAVAESAAHDAAIAAELRGNAYTLTNRDALRDEIQTFGIAPLEDEIAKLKKHQPRPVFEDPRNYLGGK